MALSSHRGLAKGTRAPMGVASDDSSPTTLASTITSPSASTATAPGAASSMALRTAVASLLRFSFFSFLTPLASTLFLFSFFSFFSLLSLAILCVMCGCVDWVVELELVAGVGITFFFLRVLSNPAQEQSSAAFHNCLADGFVPSLLPTEFSRSSSFFKLPRPCSAFEQDSDHSNY